MLKSIDINHVLSQEYASVSVTTETGAQLNLKTLLDQLNSEHIIFTKDSQFTKDLNYFVHYDVDELVKIATTNGRKVIGI